MKFIVLIYLVIFCSLSSQANSCPQLFSQNKNRFDQPGHEAIFEIENVPTNSKIIKKSKLTIERGSELVLGHMGFLPGIYHLKYLVETSQQLVPIHLRDTHKAVLSAVNQIRFDGLLPPGKEITLSVKSLDGLSKNKISDVKKLDLGNAFFKVHGQLLLTRNNALITDAIIVIQIVPKKLNFQDLSQIQNYVQFNGKLVPRKKIDHRNPKAPLATYDELLNGLGQIGYNLTSSDLDLFLPQKSQMRMIHAVIEKPQNIITGLKTMNVSPNLPKPYVNNSPLQYDSHNRVTAILDTKYLEGILDHSNKDVPLLMREHQIEAMLQTGIVSLYENYNYYLKKYNLTKAPVSILLREIYDLQLFQDIPYGGQVKVLARLVGVDLNHSPPLFHFEAQILSLDGNIKYSEARYSGLFRKFDLSEFY